jgi:hypothetical protein
MADILAFPRQVTGLSRLPQADSRLRRHRQVLRLHRLGPGALSMFFEPLEAGADLYCTLSLHTNESRSFIDILRQTLPYGRWRDRDGTVWLFNRRYVPIWRKSAGGLPEAVSGSRGEPWVDWIEQHWFFRNSPFCRNAESRALRRELEDVLQEFLLGATDGPAARRRIAATEQHAEERVARIGVPR